jgi:hypothetical protein
VPLPDLLVDRVGAARQPLHRAVDEVEQHGGEDVGVRAVRRAAGRAADGPDAAVLASVLLDLVDRAVERLARSAGSVDEPTRERYAEAVVTVWLRSIYGGDA